MILKDSWYQISKELLILYSIYGTTAIKTYRSDVSPTKSYNSTLCFTKRKKKLKTCLDIKEIGKYRLQELTGGFSNSKTA